MTGSVKSCCIPGCDKTRAENVVLHAFPDPIKEKERFITWVNAVGESISSLDHQHIYKNRKICHNHFEEKYLTWTRKLSYGATPTVDMPGIQVFVDVTNVQQYEQDYAVPTNTPGVQYFVVADLQPMETDSPSQEFVASTTSNKAIKGATFKNENIMLAKLLKKMINRKDNYAACLKKAKMLSGNVTFKKKLSKFTSLAMIFWTMQFRAVTKHKIGRRFSEQEKIMALSPYKGQAFDLPSPLTLSRLIAQADLRAGIHKKLFNLMQKKTKEFKGDDKLCILLFDEIAFAPHFNYNLRKDEVSGFVVNGHVKQKKVADHALVFMIRGVLRNYKQPVAYKFCSGSNKKEELAMLVTEVIKELHSVGFKVLATVCDQRASNISCINHLISITKAKYLRKGEEFKTRTFKVDNEEVVPLYDPPHLIKGIRNNLLDNNLKCTIDGETKIAKWEHLIKLHEEHPEYGGICLIKKLTDHHIKPEKCKMKVKFATQVFSEQVASTMGYLATKNILPQECTQTADVLLFFDQLFDSVNGSKENLEKRSGKLLLRNVTRVSKHKEVWANAKKVLSSMKFFKNGSEVIVPSVTNWLHTLNNLEYLRDVLFNKYKIKSIWTGHFNQDPLENFFGSIG